MVATPKKSKTPNGCRDKRAYPGRKSARAAAKRLKRNTGFARAYPCDRCGRWHLTTRRRLREAPNARHDRRGVKRGRRPRDGETIEELAARMRAERLDEES